MLESNLLMNSLIPSKSHRTSGTPSHLCHDKGLTSCNMQCMQLSICSEFFLFWPFNKSVWKATLDNVVLQLLCRFYFDHLSVSLV